MESLTKREIVDPEGAWLRHARKTFESPFNDLHERIVVRVERDFVSVCDEQHE